VDVSVIVVTYRCRDEARECLAALYERTTGVSFEVVVLDNASGDGTAEALRSEFPQASLIPLDENLGFAGGVNRAAAEAAGDHLLLLNPDAIVHEGAVERLVEFAQAHPRHGLYGGRNLNPDGTVFINSVRGLPSLWSLLCFATMLSTAFPGSRLFDPEALGAWQRDSVREVGSVIGSFLLVPRTVWEELGGFDTRFFMYGEDVDLSLRAGAAGYRPVFVPDAVVTHELGASTDSRPERMAMVYRGKATVIRKHWPQPRRDLGLLLLWAAVGVRALLSGPAGSRSGRRPGSVWPGVWERRRVWLAGYPSPPAREATASPSAAARSEVG
jgi:N-acetylglucosaminyl-diphospho-decaprenol L-rhamnosyltransferase